jgi:hypothetical protein
VRPAKDHSFMASREEKEAIPGLLRRSLSHQAPADHCLEPELLAAYFEHSLARSETEQCDLHLSRCAQCREQLAALIRADEPREGHAPEPQPARAWLLDWRWLTAAAAGLAVITLWAATRPERIAKVAAPPVAMTRQEGGANAPAKHEQEKSANIISTHDLSPVRSAPLPQRSVKPSGQANGEGAQSFAPSVVAGRESAGRPSGNPPAVASNFAKVPPGDAGAGVLGSEAGPIESARASAAAARAERRLPAASQMVGVQTGTKKDRSVLNGPEISPEAKTQSSDSRASSLSAAASALPAPPNAASSRVAEPSTDIASAYRAVEEISAQQTLEQRTSEKVIDTPDASVKWRITKPGFIERTENGGATWFGVEVDSQGSLRDASAPDAKTCWAVGRAGAVYVTKNAQTWKKVAAPTSADLVAVSAKNGSSATVTAADGQRFRTHDGGKKWKPLPSSPDSNHR